MIYTSRVFLYVTAGALLFHQARLHRLQAEPAPASQQQLIEEVKSLRKELFEHLRERQSVKVEALEKELDQVHRGYLRIETALQAHEREMTEWMNELQTSELSPQDRAQAESAKRDAHAEGARKLHAKRENAAAREDDLAQRLSREKDRLRRVRETLDALMR